MIFATKIAFFPKTPIIFSEKTDNFRAINIFYAKCTGVWYSFRLSLQNFSFLQLLAAFREPLQLLLHQGGAAMAQLEGKKR